MIKLNLLFTTILLTVFATIVQAQSPPAAQPRYKDVVADNPTAEADMKVVSDFINALTNNNLDKAKSLLAEKYKGYGPSPLDSSTIEQTINGWKESNKIQLNPKVSFVTQTFRVLSGNLQGIWVLFGVITDLFKIVKMYPFPFNTPQGYQKVKLKPIESI